MTKLLVRSFVGSLVAMLCAPALAGPSPATAPAPASSTLQLAFKLVAGNNQRHYTVKLVDKACGSVRAEQGEIHDEIKVCARVEGANVNLGIGWELHDSARVIKNDSTMLLARGATQELDGGTAKLFVTLQ